MTRQGLQNTAHPFSVSVRKTAPDSSRQWNMELPDSMDKREGWLEGWLVKRLNRLCAGDDESSVCVCVCVRVRVIVRVNDCVSVSECEGL